VENNRAWRDRAIEGDISLESRWGKSVTDWLRNVHTGVTSGRFINVARTLVGVYPNVQDASIRVNRAMISRLTRQAVGVYYDKWVMRADLKGAVTPEMRANQPAEVTLKEMREYGLRIGVVGFLEERVTLEIEDETPRVGNENSTTTACFATPGSRETRSSPDTSAGSSPIGSSV
jgi:hypothetical protein